jgi:hypothetical protein
MRPSIYCVISFLFLACQGCVQRPKVDVMPRLLDGQVAFDVSASGIHQLTAFRVYNNAGNRMWVVILHGHKFTTIKYGIVPTGGLSDALQLFPEEGKAPPDIQGKTVVVEVGYQYDAIAPSSGTFKKTVQIP